MQVGRRLRAVISILDKQGKLYKHLILLEWAEEKNRLWKMLIASILGLGFLCCSLVFIGALVLMLTWETPYRNSAIIGLVIVYTGGAITAWCKFRSLAARSMLAFADTRKELSADIALIRSKLTQ